MYLLYKSFHLHYILCIFEFLLWGCWGWGWQAAGTWVLVSVKWWDSPPPLGDVEPANQYTPSKMPARELKSQRAPKFEQRPAPFVPIELPCKHVAHEVCTNRIAL